MSISINFNGKTIFKPGSYSKTTVDLTGGFPIAPAGSVGIVGEADAGMPGSADDIRTNFFTPGQMAEVFAKYKSGPIVDAFRLLAVPSNDARIANGANKIYIYKTNASTQASGTLPTAYGTIESRNYGWDENTLNFQVASAQSEQGPQFASFAWMTDEANGAKWAVRVNGGAKQSVTINAADTPADVVTAFNLGVAGVLAGGGTDRVLLAAGNIGAGKTIGLTASANGTIITLALALTTWNVNPTVGDTLYIPTGSAIQGAGGENVGGYLITSVTTTGLVALKLSDLTQAAATVAPTLIVAATDAQAFAPITLTYTATTPAGQGASVEMFDDAGTVDLLDSLSGGTDREVINAARVADGSTVAIAATGSDVVVTISTAWAAVPAAGDVMRIRGGSPIDGAGVGIENIGNYLVTAATTTTISATKISGTPATVTAVDIVAITDVEVFAGEVSTSAVPLASVSGLEPKITINLTRNSDEESEDSTSLGGNILMTVGYDGTTCTCTIDSVNITLTAVGGSGASHTIPLASYSNVQALVDYIDSLTGYSAAVGSAIYAALPPSALDRVAAINVCEEFAGTMPGRIKRDSYEVQNFFDNSELCELTRTLFVGLPTTMASPVFLTGGVKGGSTAASVSTGIDEFQKVRINSLVPLFSRDAVDDILEELTEPSSTYQISAVNAAAKAHCILMSNTTSRSERNAYCSIKDTFVNSKTEAEAIASARVSLCIQDVKVLKTDGTLDWVNPWGMACVAAGMQAGAVIGEPMTFKFVNISGITHTDFDAATEYDDAIDHGILFAEQPEQGGFRIVLGNTTYGTDANFVYNRISVLYAADSVAYNLRQQLEAIFVGVGLAVADATSIKNTCIQILGTFLAAGMIVGDDTNGGTGFKNLSVSITGNICTISVVITVVQGLDFVLPSIVLDNIRQSA